jgi:hypothetical protein
VARTKKTRDHPDMPREIDFRGGQRGRYAEMLARGIRIIISKKKPKKA